MGRAIPEDKPLSDKDRAFLVERQQLSLVRQIDAVTLADDDSDDVDVDEDIADFAEKLTVPKLEDRLLKLIDDGVEIEIPEKAKKADLVSLYAVALQDKRDAGEEVVLEDNE